MYMYGFRFNAILFSCAVCWAFILINDRMMPTNSAAAAAATTRMRKIIFTKIEHAVNDDFLKMDVVLKDGPNGSPVVDVEAILFKDLDEPIYINNTISKRLTPTDYQPLLKTGRLNMCDFLKKPDREPFLKMLIDTVTKHGALIFQCPAKKGNYHLNDFELNASSLPSFTPAGDYRVDFSVAQKNNDVFSMVWFAKVVDTM